MKGKAIRPCQGVLSLRKFKKSLSTKSIVLIPKKSAKKIKDFRLISLVRGLYKILVELFF